MNEFLNNEDYEDSLENDEKFPFEDEWDEDEETDFDYCPVCGCPWGIEEISFQECDSCGYPSCVCDEEGNLYWEDWENEGSDWFDEDLDDEQ